MNEGLKKEGGGNAGSGTWKKKIQTPTLLFLKGGGGIMTHRYCEQSKGKSRSESADGAASSCVFWYKGRQIDWITLF